ncbi:MAG: STAS domain-containing protein [Bryobacteraceae bacterium]|nr:STAS domain-containing protein [Bryobacteraceae bacterium]
MNVVITEVGDVSTIRLDGSIDGKTAPLVREQIAPTLEKASKVILDMTKVNYLSSAGLRLLLLVYREFAAKKGKLVLLNVSPEIQSVMSHTGFLSFFTLAGSDVEAMGAFA